MPQVVQENIRKRDFRIDFTLPVIPGEDQTEVKLDQKLLAESVYSAKPSFLYPRLSLEIRQPIIGNIATTVIRLCQRGLPVCRLRTIMPDMPELTADDASHVIYTYHDGEVVEQETDMCRDVILGDDLLLHTLVIRFDKWRIDTNVWENQVTTKRPPLAIVQDGRLIPV